MWRSYYVPIFHQVYNESMQLSCLRGFGQDVFLPSAHEPLQHADIGLSKAHWENLALGSAVYYSANVKDLIRNTNRCAGYGCVHACFSAHAPHLFALTSAVRSGIVMFTSSSRSRRAVAHV